PPRHLRVRQSAPAHDSRGDCIALSGQLRRQAELLHPRDPRGPEPAVVLDAVQFVARSPLVQGRCSWRGRGGTRGVKVECPCPIERRDYQSAFSSSPLPFVVVRTGRSCISVTWSRATRVSR